MTQNVTLIPDDRLEEAEPASTSNRGAGPMLAAGGAVIAALVWIVTVAATAGSGFDLTDEGFYLLSYRWWDTNVRTFTAVQYLYGPVFEFLGYDITALRWFRLVTVVAGHAAFGWAFMGWLRTRRPSAPATRLWEFAGAAAIVAAGGITYGWLPLSPGYNDVSLLAGMIAAAVALATATRVGTGATVPWWLPFVLGMAGATSLLVKWASTAAILMVVAATMFVVLKPLGRRGILRFIGWAVLGGAAALAIVHFLLTPLTVIVPQMLAVNRLAAASSNTPAYLLQMYWDSTVDVVTRSVQGHKLMFAATLFALLARGRKMVLAASALCAAGLAYSAWRVYRDGGLGGGTINLIKYPTIVTALALAAVVIAAGTMLRRRLTAGGSTIGTEGAAGWAIFTMLFLLPAVQAFGTGNPLYFMAVNGFAAWTAIMIAVMTGVERAGLAVRGLAAAVTAGAVASAAIIGASGVSRHPYRTAPFSLSTADTGIPALDGIKLDPKTAQNYDRLYQLLRPYVEPGGRAIMAFDEMAGIVLMLNGRPVGEAWYSQLVPSRSSAGIVETCASGAWWGERQPILIFNRDVRQMEIDALRSCGLAFDTDYRLLVPKEESLNLAIYVPAHGT